MVFKRTGRRRLFPIATVLNGKRVPARAQEIRF
jgi:hypothetical protein